MLATKEVLIFQFECTDLLQRSTDGEFCVYKSGLSVRYHGQRDLPSVETLRPLVAIQLEPLGFLPPLIDP